MAISESYNAIDSDDYDGDFYAFLSWFYDKIALCRSQYVINPRLVRLKMNKF